MLPVIHIGLFPFYTFGIVFGLAICAGAYAFGRYFECHHLPVNLPALCITLIVAGLLGAKLDNPRLLLEVGRGHFFAAVREQFLHGGYTYLGCVVAGVAAGTVFARVNHLPWLKSFDSMFCMGLGYAIGRIGCFLSGDGDYGLPSNLPWAMSFPHGTIPTFSRVHPTMLYTTLYELMLFAMLWKLSSPRRRSPLPPGSILGLYLLLTSTGRFLVEFLSRNPRIAFGLTEAQIVSLALACAGAGIIATIAVSVQNDASTSWSSGASSRVISEPPRRKPSRNAPASMDVDLDSPDDFLRDTATLRPNFDQSMATRSTLTDRLI